MIEWFRADLSIRSNEKFDELGDHLSSTCRPDVVAVSSESRIAVGDVCPAFARLVAVGCVMVFFANVAEHRPDGDLSGLSDSTLERWAGWEGARGAFAEAFMSLFVTDGHITGWRERQAGLIATQQEKEARRVAKRERDKLATRERRAGDKATTDRRQIDDKPAYTNTNTNRTTSSSPRASIQPVALVVADPVVHESARAELEASLDASTRKRFRATCDGYLDGLALAAGLRATEADIEQAAADWIQNNSGAKLSALAFRAYVEKIIRHRKADAVSAPAQPVPGFTRKNGQASAGEQGYINAALSSQIDPYDLTLSQRKT